jgi:ArsR family transcriptional regulator, arsenate/arsenite/antimonite-responsive transcriptional repressor
MTHEHLLKITKALADSTRFRILQAIAAAEEISCGALAKRFPITQATCSQHLKILAEAGLITMRRERQFHHYHLVRDTLEVYHRALEAALEGVKPVA